MNITELILDRIVRLSEISDEIPDAKIRENIKNCIAEILFMILISQKK